MPGVWEGWSGNSEQEPDGHGVFTLGALLTSLFEPLVYRLGGQERGPATAVRLRPDVHPPQSDRWLYPAGPLVAFLGVALATVVVPLDSGLIGSDLGIGVFYFIVVVDFVVLGIAVGAWEANTANAVEACYRIVAQLVAYVVPLGLALMGPVMMARSLSTMHIVTVQAELWFIILQPLGFALYVVPGLMQTYRPPFLEPFANDIHHGIIEAYGGGKALVWRVALC